MATNHPRINVTLDDDLFKIVKQQADAQGISLSLKIRDLVATALNFSEDKVWLKKVQERRKTFRKKEALSHDDVWNT